MFVGIPVCSTPVTVWRGLPPECRWDDHACAWTGLQRVPSRGLPRLVGACMAGVYVYVNSNFMRHFLCDQL